MQVHKGTEGHLVGFALSLHLQAIRNLPTGFTLPVTYHIRKSSLQAWGEMLTFLWRRFKKACFSLELSGCPVTCWAVLTSSTCQPEVSRPTGWGPVTAAMHLPISTQIPEPPSLGEDAGAWLWFRIWIFCFWPSEDSKPAVRRSKRSCD